MSAYVSRRRMRDLLHRLLSGPVAGLLALLLVPGPASAGDETPSGGGDDDRARDAPRIDHARLDVLLKRYVTPDGVRYADWHASAEDRVALERYLAETQELPVSRLGPSPEDRAEALAFWINLYNAATLDLVLDGYPVRSIKDLGGILKSPWEKDVVVVEGRALTLDAIENDVVRPTFTDPRIHFALNCAARSCPPLRAEAYTGERLEAQLDEQTRRFLADARYNRLEGDGRLRLSKVFDWYAQDFEAASGSVAEWVRPWVPALTDGESPRKIDIRYDDYDWGLNEAPALIPSRSGGPGPR